MMAFLQRYTQLQQQAAAATRGGGGGGSSNVGQQYSPIAEGVEFNDDEDEAEEEYEYGDEEAHYQQRHQQLDADHAQAEYHDEAEYYDDGEDDDVPPEQRLDDEAAEFPEDMNSSMVAEQRRRLLRLNAEEVRQSRMVVLNASRCPSLGA